MSVVSTDFDLDVPSRLEEALAILSAGDGAVVPIAGGTNLIVDLRARRVAPRRLVSLTRLGALRGIRVENGQVRVGAGTTITDLLHSPDLAAHAPCLVEQARVFGGQMVRNAATVAGNVCSGSPAADSVPALLALDAQVELASAQGTRTLALSSFFRGYKDMERRPDELLTAFTFARPPARSASAFYKLARRHGDAITVVGVAVAVTMQGERCASARIALGAVAPFVKRATAAESMLEGEVPGPDVIEAAARRAAAEAEPIDDLRASAAYRRRGVRVLTRRLLAGAVDVIARTHDAESDG